MNATVSDQGRVPDMPQRNGVGKAPSQKTKVPPKAGSATWLVPALLVLSVVPLAAGAVRLTELASGAEITPANARFFAAPLPIVLHIVGAGVYAMGARSSSQAGSGGAGPAGTAWLGGSWLHPACWLGCPGCG